MRKAFLIAFMTICPMMLAAAAKETTQPHDQHVAELHLDYPHPTLPAETRWVGATTLLILGMFLAAAAVGVVVRLNAPEELPETHSHDEPPGASHHHGPGGTAHPAPEHDLPGHGSGGHH